MASPRARARTLEHVHDEAVLLRLLVTLARSQLDLAPPMGQQMREGASATGKSHAITTPCYTNTAKTSALYLDLGAGSPKT